jgi:hypothetical protein
MLRSILWRSGAGMLLAAAAFEILLRHLAWTSTDSATGLKTAIQRLNEGSGVSRWDARGVRLSPAENGPVVLAAGDSFIEGLQVNDDEVLTARLATLIGVRVLNVGRASQSPADYCLLAPERLKQFKPAWTVIEINSSDLSDDSFNPSKTHFVLRNSQLVPVEPPPFRLGRISRTLAVIRGNSALANYAIARIDMFRYASQSPPLFRAADRVQPPPPPLAPERDWPVEDELSLMSSAYEGRVTFFFIPDFEAKKAPEERRFLDYCHAANLSCADLRASFGKFSAHGHAPFGFPNSRFAAGHLNAEGHRAAASLLAQELSKVRGRGLF